AVALTVWCLLLGCGATYDARIGSPHSCCPVRKRPTVTEPKRERYVSPPEQATSTLDDRLGGDQHVLGSRTKWYKSVDTGHTPCDTDEARVDQCRQHSLADSP